VNAEVAIGGLIKFKVDNCPLCKARRPETLPHRRPGPEIPVNRPELTGKETRDVATGAPELFAEMDGVAG